MTSRRKFIIDIIENYKRNHPEEYSNFLDLMDYRRAVLNDKKYAKIDSEIRKAITMPDGIYNTIVYVLNGVDEEKFLEPKGEMKWFIKKFPEFLISNSY